MQERWNNLLQSNGPNKKYSWDLVQGGLEIPCILMVRAVKDLVDKASKLLAISDMKAAETINDMKVTDTVETSLSVETKESDELSEAPAIKRIKVEQTEMKAKIEKSQVVWTAFPSTRIQLHIADKSLIQDSCKLSDKHINFTQAILRAQFPQCDGLQNTLLQNQLRLSELAKLHRYFISVMITES